MPDSMDLYPLIGNMSFNQKLINQNFSVGDYKT